MFVIVAGGGRVGTQLALLLLEHKYKVNIIEERRELLNRLHGLLPTEIIFAGSPSNPQTLEMAGIQQANVVASCTSSDAENLAICFMARQYYKVPRTIGRINDPRNAWLFDREFHVDVALNQAAIFASLIAEEMSLGDMMTLLKLRRGNYSLVVEKIPEGALAIGKSIQNLNLPESCVIAAIIRDEKVIAPRGSTVFIVNDEVYAVTDPQGAESLSALFCPYPNRNNRVGELLSVS